MLDTESHQWLDEHMNRAERFIYFFYATAALAIAALAFSKKFPKACIPLAVLTLTLGVASLGTAGWISRAGGEVSHSEFRGEEAPPNAPAHEHSRDSHEHGKDLPKDSHEHGEATHEKMQSSDTGGHKHGATPEHTAEKTLLPDTLEGIWKAIHGHHSGLQSAVNDKKFSDVQAHAKELDPLVRKLVEVAHPEHKPAVESGINQMVYALDELKSSAETGSEVVMKSNFKDFEAALEQLEQQMKKQ